MRRPSEYDEIPLTQGLNKRIVRVGEQVYRPQNPNSPFVHQVLDFLASQGFDGAPRYLGEDFQGREILRYIEGEVPSNLGVWSDEQLYSVAQLIRRFHDQTAYSQLSAYEEVVCHNDLSPCNTVFVNGLPKALIDFDGAAPGSRSSDLAYAIWLWLNFTESNLPPEIQGPRIQLMCEAYGWKDLPKILDAIYDIQLRELSRFMWYSPDMAYVPKSIRWLKHEISWLSSRRQALEACFKA